MVKTKSCFEDECWSRSNNVIRTSLLDWVNDDNYSEYLDLFFQQVQTYIDSNWKHWHNNIHDINSLIRKLKDRWKDVQIYELKLDVIGAQILRTDIELHFSLIDLYLGSVKYSWDQAVIYIDKIKRFCSELEGKNQDISLYNSKINKIEIEVYNKRIWELFIELESYISWDHKAKNFIYRIKKLIGYLKSLEEKVKINDTVKLAYWFEKKLEKLELLASLEQVNRYILEFKRFINWEWWFDARSSIKSLIDDLKNKIDVSKQITEFDKLVSEYNDRLSKM